MAFHRLLLRQLSKLKINSNAIPNKEAWLAFLERVSLCYEENDQERYTIERSMDISSREMLELNKKAEDAHRQLLELARNAGMAQVATTILHNVGNVLNSVSVSTGVILENIQQAQLSKLEIVAKMLEEHLPVLSEYLTQDPKGKLLPSYLVTFAKTKKSEYEIIEQEVQNLDQHIRHIKDIISMQQTLSGVAGMSEKIVVSEAIDSAIQMTGESFEAKGIHLKKEYENENIKIETDKSRLLQILVNLIQNAKEALIGIEQPNKSIVISAKITSNKQLEIFVSDNGAGVLTENKTRIFSLGFTTKVKGHGFGLHSSAIAAKELGGTLKLESNSIDKGATFILRLPIQYSAGRNCHVEK